MFWEKKTKQKREKETPEYFLKYKDELEYLKSLDLTKEENVFLLFKTIHRSINKIERKIHSLHESFHKKH